MKKSSKHVFWQALIIALIIFWSGILIGMLFENSRIEKLEDFYFGAKTDISDFELSSEILYEGDYGCALIQEHSVLLADKIYAEARLLEKYDDSNKITKGLIGLHRRYDLLRTILWKNIIENKERCNSDLNTVVYLYNYDNPGLNVKAIQEAMSNFLIDLKGKYGDEIILIPIAVDTNVGALDLLRGIYGLEKSPSIFVNEEFKFETLDSLENLEESLK